MMSNDVCAGTGTARLPGYITRFTRRQLTLSGVTMDLRRHPRREVVRRATTPLTESTTIKGS